MLVIILLIAAGAGGLALEYILLKRYYREKIEEKVTLIKNVEAQLIQMDKMASVGTLAAGIAHEINNPLGFLISNLESLKDYARSPRGPSRRWLAEADEAEGSLNPGGASAAGPVLIDDLKAMTEESLEGAKRIKRIVSDLRTFSRQSESSRTLTDINQILESTLSIVWNEIKYKITVEKDFQAKTSIIADPTQLSQVFLNLFINASQAIADKGRISIATYEDENDLHIKVKDSGCGIPKEVLPRIFEPFFSTKKSSGLGLSVSYNIIKHHGGKIEAQSSPGQGATFSISLPKQVSLPDGEPVCSPRGEAEGRPGRG